MKRIKILIIALLCLNFMPIPVKASSGSINVSGASTVVVGNTITVTVTLSSSSAIGSWQMDLNYDRDALKLVSSDAENGGTKMAGVTPSMDGVRSKSYTFRFKSLKQGQTSVSVSSYYILDINETEMSMSTTSLTINAITEQQLQASYSKDNTLSNLEVEGYKLDKEFNKDTLEYKVDVPTGTTKVVVNATKSDYTASVSGTGEIEVSEGLNTISIVVTAQNGDERTYTLTVNVEDQNPIEVTVDGSKYTVVKNGTLLEAPLTFIESKTKINGFEIPTFTNKNANIVLVGLKDSKGNIYLYQYENNTYIKFNQINIKTLNLIPVAFTEELDLIKTTVTINGSKYDAYKYSEKSDFVIINAKSLEDGKTSLYLYDTKGKTITNYDDTYINETTKTINNYTYIIYVFLGSLGLMLIIIFALILSLRKKQKKIKKFLMKQEAKIEATRKLNDVIDEVKKITTSEHVIKQDTTSLKDNKKQNKKDQNKDVAITEIKPENITPKEEISKIQNKEPLKPNDKEETNSKSNIKEELKQAIKEEKIEAKEETEVYNIFEDDFKKKKKKKK